MRYVFKPHFVLSHVAGAHFVVSLRPAWGKYPMIMQLADISAMIWEYVQKGTSKEETLKAVSEAFDITNEKAEQTYDGFIRYCQMKEYFLEEED